MAQKGTSVLRTPFPLYAINCIDDKHFVVAGGGGKARTGITNSIELFELKHENGKCTATSVTKFDTGDRATMNLDVCKVDSSYGIAAGQDEGCQMYTLRSRIEALKTQNSGPGSDHDPGIRKRKQGHLTKSQNYVMAQKALVFSLDTEQFIQTDFTVKSPCQNVVRFNPVGNAFVTGGADGRMRVYQLPSLEKTAEIKAHAGEVTDLCFDPTGKYICSVAKDDKCYIWDAETNEQAFEAVWKFKTPDKYRFRNCRYGSVVDKKGECRLFTTHVPIVRTKLSPCYITKWDAKKYTPSRVQTTGDEILCALAISDDGTYLGAGTISGSVTVFISFSLKPLYHLKSAHSIFVTGLAFTPNTPTALSVTGGYDFSLLSISADNHVRLHQTQPTAMIHIIWPILGSLIIIYLLFWFISAFGL